MKWDLSKQLSGAPKERPPVQLSHINPKQALSTSTEPKTKNNLPAHGVPSRGAHRCESLRPGVCSCDPRLKIPRNGKQSMDIRHESATRFYTSRPSACEVSDELGPLPASPKHPTKNSVCVATFCKYSISLHAF